MSAVLTARELNRATLAPSAPGEQRDAVQVEGAALLAFLHPRDTHDLRIGPPPTIAR